MRRSTRLLQLLAGTAFAAQLSTSAHAACNPVPTAGNDTFTCDSGATGTLTDTQGNNTLLFPAGGMGTINGDVTFGGGADRIDMQSGQITGNVTQGAGNDVFTITDGTVLGALDQGNGTDTLIINGGTIGSVTQGSQLDVAEMHGGRIIGLFFAGDDFTMTGGRIGEVDLEQANNVMRMSGGSIDTNVSAAQGNDLLQLSGGTIGGTVNLGNGNDTVIVTGGSIGGDVITFNQSSPAVQLNGNNVVSISGGSIGGSVRTGQGSDTFTWDTAGFIGGSVLLGAGNDTATLRNLTEATLSSSPQIDGGSGPDVTTGLQTDQLVFDNTSATTAARYVNWENVSLTNNSKFTLDTNFVLGDAGTGTGTFAIDASSTLLVGGNPSISPFTAGQMVTLTNAGTIDLTQPNATATNSLTVMGNYVGAGGRLLINTVLGTDGSPSDKLIISGGTATGTTGIGVFNLGGAGATTTADGILVVEAVNGGTTAPTAFGLTNAVAAGAYEYFLFRGGVTAGTDNNWYLRSQLLPGTPPVGNLPPPPPPGAPPVPLLREEVPVYAAIPAVARQLDIATLGTFHERQGDQSLLHGNGGVSAAWARVFGSQTEQRWNGTVAPDFDGTIAGFQTGFDLFGRESDGGHRDRIGLFFGHARANGDIHGDALAQSNLAVGNLTLDSTSVGAYWTHLGPTDWYVDSVVMGSWFDGNPQSNRHVGINADGNAFTASIEGGYPISLGSQLTLEPQAQLIFQHLSLSQTADEFSTIDFQGNDALTGRLGLRLQGRHAFGESRLEPYLIANLWQDFSGHDNVALATDIISTDRGATAVELGGGIVASLSQTTSLYVTGSYTTDVDSGSRETIKGNLGLRVAW